MLIPVRLPPGRRKLSTIPPATGSPLNANKTGSCVPMRRML